MCVSLVGAVPRGGILSCRSFYLQCKQSFVSVWTTIGGDQVREDVGESGGGKIECGSGGPAGAERTRTDACLAFPLPWPFICWLWCWWLVVVVGGGGRRGGRWRRSLSARNTCETADCERPATKTKRNGAAFAFCFSERKRRDAAQQRQRLAMEDKERSKAHEAVTQTAT